MVRVILHRPLVEALFALDEDRQEHAAQQPPAAPAVESTSPTAAAVAALLRPSGEDHPVCSAVVMAAQASSSSLEATAQMLARLGYTVRLHTSAGGSIYQLKHTYITAARNTASGEPAEWIIDPSFASAFAVACPTPRYARILGAVPPVLVAPLPRLVRALLLLGAELARCFEEQGIPLPPWRRVDAYATKYDAVSSVPVHPIGGVAPQAAKEAAATAAGAPRAAAPQVAAAAAARKQQRDRQQLEGVQLRLARLGLLQQQAPASPASSCGASPCGSDAGVLGESPSSVLAASQAMRGSGASARVVGFAAAAECPPCRWRPKNSQTSRRPAGLLGWRLQRRDVAASAA
ncbi:hypothetical protein CHLNCDRAFT_137872 [Chlorella variabilis]|uniref:Uncharacterized protein n=1 Tax=Chlorella variabilis TaxID=554065 RepID=E1Z4Q2_CHLVA|nr:hypothetical protein CHLNCDRAFT_137872 [Chlorella variabilis]EFN59388.1 hypothetical protein CHLNCDRAFT_137872 [Chlorella variabilis]|eukprot:XP_005851490.1 hypothetical protein CHLNCDRAFT_137872 [Chlorella variabilis]